MKNYQPRTLAVIVHADVVGSTLLVQKNETLAHQRIRATYQQFSGIISSYHGTTHEIRGDALVAEFARASDAVAAALAFQVENTAQLASLDDDIKPEVRIGISMGEVVIADSTVTGAGVVLAQRLEQLAEPGGICIQSAASETVPRRLPFVYSSMGKQQVKGFEEPVRAYSIVLKSGETIPPPDPASTDSRRILQASIKPVHLIGALTLVVVVGIFVARWPPATTTHSTEAEQTASEVERQPSIAVLPFQTLSDESAQDYFSDGVTNDIITDLSKFSNLLVIASNSVFTYKNKPVIVKDVGRELGVRYVLEGSIQKSGNRVCINAQLIDAESDHHLWADRYDFVVDDIFKVAGRNHQHRGDVATGRVDRTGKESPGDPFN